MQGSIAPDAPLGENKVGRRKAARLRLSIPAKLVTIYATHPCVLVDLSRTGARIALEQPLASGEAGFLRFLDRELFVCAVRTQRGFNGLEFEPHLSDEQVLDIRSYAGKMDMIEKRRLMEDVRNWVAGKV